MKSEKLSTQTEIFICNHKKENDECCFDKGAKDLTDTLKKWTKNEHQGKIKVYRSGCLGKCSEGIAIACYPEKKLLLDVKESEITEIKKILESFIVS